MEDRIIEVRDLTKDYRQGHGIFHIDLEIAPGMVYGYIGTNGSGKTTTIRNIMGFIKPDSGVVTVKGKDTWKYAPELKNYMSYIPGEIEFPKFPTGSDFLKYQAQHLGITDFTYMNRLISMLQLDPSANLRRMSKGMKQKTAIVAALMGNKDILILDEPTTGLDPLMRDVFLNLIRQEKKNGKTVLMSSHIFEEIEEVCDQAAIIHNGKIVDRVDIHKLRHPVTKTFYIGFSSLPELHEFQKIWVSDSDVDENALECTVIFNVSRISELLSLLKQYQIRYLREKHISLEDRFKQAL
jgi:ABC-2 type transport system ATP-binding protein